jgi:elongation factor Ts
MISIDQIKQLRQETGVSISECKKALEEGKGDFEKAKEILRKLGRELAGKKADRTTKEGIIVSYIHPNKKVGVLLEIRCESDFVGKSEDFQKLGHEICLQIAAMKPIFVSEEDIPADFIAKEKKIYQEQMKDLNKPKKILDGIIEGKLEKYKKDVCLFSQPWIKDETKNIRDLIEPYVAKVGENIIVKKFERYEI